MAGKLWPERANWYSEPDALDLAGIDPLLRETVERINGSGWCWTAESCQGHPDDSSEYGPWANNTKPMMRFVVWTRDLGRLMSALVRSMYYDREGGLLTQSCFFEVFPLPPARHFQEYTELLVYIQARTVWQRDEGCRAYGRLADLVLRDG